MGVAAYSQKCSSPPPPQKKSLLGNPLTTSWCVTLLVLHFDITFVYTRLWACISNCSFSQSYLYPLWL